MILVATLRRVELPVALRTHSHSISLGSLFYGKKKKEIMDYMGWMSYNSEWLGVLIFFFFNELFVEYVVHLLLYWPNLELVWGFLLLLLLLLLFMGLRIIFGRPRLFLWDTLYPQYFYNNFIVNSRW